MSKNKQSSGILNLVIDFARECFNENDYKFFWQDRTLNLYFRNVHAESVEVFASFIREQIHSNINYKLLDANDDFWGE